MLIGKSSGVISKSVSTAFPSTTTIPFSIPFFLQNRTSQFPSFRTEFKSTPSMAVSQFFSTLMAEAPISSRRVIDYHLAAANLFLVNSELKRTFSSRCVGCSVYSLWQAPDMLPSFVLKGGEVSQFIIGGADLMFPGIAIPPEGLPSFSAGEIWSVKVPGNPAPIAVRPFLFT